MTSIMQTGAPSMFYSWGTTSIEWLRRLLSTAALDAARERQQPASDYQVGIVLSVPVK
jgi:hypothetical protein